MTDFFNREWTQIDANKNYNNMKTLQTSGAIRVNSRPFAVKNTLS
jgi:hypothetical protein